MIGLKTWERGEERWKGELGEGGDGFESIFKHVEKCLENQRLSLKKKLDFNFFTALSFSNFWPYHVGSAFCNFFNIFYMVNLKK
jgi:hypothetical protein